LVWTAWCFGAGLLLVAHARCLTLNDLACSLVRSIPHCDLGCPWPLVPGVLLNNTARPAPSSLSDAYAQEDGEVGGQVWCAVPGSGRQRWMNVLGAIASWERQGWCCMVFWHVVPEPCCWVGQAGVGVLMCRPVGTMELRAEQDSLLFGPPHMLVDSQPNSLLSSATSPFPFPLPSTSVHPCPRLPPLDRKTTYCLSRYASTLLSSASPTCPKHPPLRHRPASLRWPLSSLSKLQPWLS
jgi:hypothetical protein